jgi:type I restriction enzyme S subunit
MREDWVLTSLESIAEGDNAIVDGPFGSNLKRSDYIEKTPESVPVLTTKNLEGDYSENTVRFISREKYYTLKRSTVRSGDIIVAKIGSIGKNGVYPDNHPDAIIPANLLKFTVSRYVSRRYVRHFINSHEFQSKLKEISTATAQPAFNVTKFRKLSIPLPPLPEQRAIVAKIEQLFSELDNGIANLKAAQEKLEIYRQAVLKKAFEGELTKEWRRKIGNINHVMKKVRLDEISDIGTGSTPKKGNDNYWIDGTVPWITSKELNNDFVDSPSDFITETALRETNCKIFPVGTLLIALYGEGKTRGKSSELRIPAATNQAIAAIQLHKDHSESKDYIKAFLQKNYHEIRMVSSGGVQPNLNCGKIKEIEIPYPDIAEQKEIVNEIERRISIYQNAVDQLKGSEILANVLKQSILKKAFSGQLLNTTELDACKQEADWEPASKLLERIKSEVSK